jgi:hypothetical protein
VKFSDHWAAERCIEKLNGRFFGGKTISAEFYDGWTDYEVSSIRSPGLSRTPRFFCSPRWRT